MPCKAMALKLSIMIGIKLVSYPGTSDLHFVLHKNFDSGAFDVTICCQSNLALIRFAKVRQGKSPTQGCVGLSVISKSRRCIVNFLGAEQNASHCRM